VVQAKDRFSYGFDTSDDLDCLAQDWGLRLDWEETLVLALAASGMAWWAQETEGGDSEWRA
jgi:hypothetical protein